MPGQQHRLHRVPPFVVSPRLHEKAPRPRDGELRGSLVIAGGLLPAMTGYFRLEPEWLP
jgi:hypothetical protein